MRTFDFKNEYPKLLQPDIVAMLTAIHEQKGERSVQPESEAVEQLLEIAMIQSTEASNRIEGIITTDDRLKKLVQQKTMPKTRSEREIAGYRDVLSTIHGNYAYIPPRPSMILQLHRDLYKFSGKSIGGSFKAADNVISEELPDGTRRVRFVPLPAWETPQAMDDLCAAFDGAIKDPECDPLLLIPMFILDFLCIHPFADGNGRMSRLLTLLLLYRAGYTVGKYISLEKLISDTKESYYEALRISDQGWLEEQHDPVPFIKYMLGVMLACYRDFESRITIAESAGSKSTAYDIVKNYASQKLGKFTKQDVFISCPSIGRASIEAALKKLTEEGFMVRMGAGRSTCYAKR